MRTIAIANAKGGTGKSTLAVHLADGLALRGRRTLLVDLDFQANATKWLLDLRTRPPAEAPGVSRALEGGALAIQETRREGLSVVPATDALPGSEYRIANQPAGQSNLRTALRRASRLFDYCIIDCPPNLGVACVSGLCASDAVFVPIPPGFLGLSGLSDLEDALKRLRDGFRVATTVRGLVLFAVDSREALSDATRQLLRAHVGKKLMAAEVRVSTAAKRLPEAHRTAWEPGADARGAEDYPRVLDEVLRRIGARRER